MAEDLWRRPATPSDLAGSVAARLASEHQGGETFVRRDRADGTVEAVGRRKGRLTHYLIYEDGSVETVAQLGPTVTFRLGRWLSVGGSLVAFGAMVVSAELQLENLPWGPLIGGILAAVLGALLWSSDSDLWEYIRSRTGSEVGWVELPYDMSGWPARSSAQLEAVIELSENGEGDALVRNRADGMAEVATKRKGHRHICMVDPAGAIHDATFVPPTGSQRLGMSVRNAGAVVFWPSWLSIFISETAALACIGSATLIWLTGLLLEQRLSQASGDDGYGPWYKVVTTPPDS